jgi:hypothetical protein
LFSLIEIDSDKEVDEEVGSGEEVNGDGSSLVSE